MDGTIRPGLRVGGASSRCTPVKVTSRPGSTHRYGPGLGRTQSRSVANMRPVQYPALVAYTENRR